MKFSSNSSSKPYLEPATTSVFSGKKAKTFQRISPFQLKPQSLSEKEREDLYQHICEIKTSYSTFKHYFIEQKLYRPTELVDKFWEIAWFGHHLPLEQLAQFLIERFKTHPSKLLQLMIQHRGFESGKRLTSLTIVFQQYYWLSSENEFTVMVGEKKVMGVVKPGWNLEKSKQMFQSVDDQHKYHWLFKDQSQDGDVSQSFEVSMHSEDDFEDKPSKKHKPNSSYEEISHIAERIPEKQWIKCTVQEIVKSECQLVKEEVIKSQLRLLEYLEQIKAMIQGNTNTFNQQKKGQDKSKDPKKKGGKRPAMGMNQEKIDQPKLDSMLTTPKIMKLEEEEVEQK